MSQSPNASNGEPSQGSPDPSVDNLSSVKDSTSEKDKLQDVIENENQEEKPADKKKDKDYLLGGRKPLITVMDLSSGPIISQLINSFYGIITTFYLSMAVGDKGLSALSTYAIFDSVGRAFGFFLCTSASATISALFGANKAEESHQLAADIIRMCVAFGIIVPAILIPCLKPAARWFGASEEIVNLGFEYICPLSACAVFSILYIAVGGILMAEGRSGLASMLMVIALVLNMGLFGPIFLFAAKIGMKGAAWATIISESSTGIVITILYFCGFFQVKPKLKMLISKPSPHLWTSIKVGLSTLLAQLSGQIPAIIVRKLMGNACVYDSYDQVMSAYICSFRFQAVIIAIFAAINQGFIPAASYAYQAHRYNRYLWLTLHSFWTTFSWGVITSIICWIVPRDMAKLFSSEERYLDYAEQQMSIVNGLSMLLSPKFLGTSILQSTMRAESSMIISIINNLALVIVFAYVMYYTGKTDPIRITWCYSLSYICGFLFVVGFCAKPLWTMYKASKEEAPTDYGDGDKDEVHEDEVVPEL